MKKIAALLLALAMCLGCVNAMAESSVHYTPGTYTATVQGHNALVTVEVTFSEDAITDIKTVESYETVDVSDKALYTKLPQEIIEHQSVNVDSITGATISSAAMKSAVLDCVKQAGGDPAWVKTPVERPEAGAEEYTADVIIAGGGGAGLAAAVAAVDEGASVIVIEKAEYLGGNTMLCGGIYNAPNPDKQHEVKMADSVKLTIEQAISEEPVSEEHAQLIAAVKEEYDAYLASGADYLFDSENWFALQTWKAGDYMGNLDLVKYMAANAYADLEWLEDMGMELRDGITQGPGSLYQRTVTGVHLGHSFIDAYKSALEGKENCQIFLNTSAEHIMMDNGKAVGVTATGKDGTTYTFHANKGVIIATGGFAGNKELIAKYNTSGKWPDLSGLGNTNVGTTTGDGIIMGTEIGAALCDMDLIQVLHLGDPLCGGRTSRKYASTLTAGEVMFLNEEGNRFVREDGRRDEISLAIMKQPNEQYWYITSADAIPDPDNTTDYSGTPLNVLVSAGTTLKADTFEELCEKMNVPYENAKAALDDLNASYENNVLEDAFGRQLFSRELVNGPWYACKLVPSVHHTMGGLKIDVDTHVLDENGNWIEGLYAAGEVTGGIHGGNRVGGNAVVDTVVFGRTAGSNAAK